MTHDIYKAPEANLGSISELSDKEFYVVAKRKFWVLSIVTMGLYIYAWNYQHWRTIKYRDETMRDIWPVPRSIFSIFYVIGLFNWFNSSKVEEHYNWSPDGNAWAYIIAGVATNIASYIPPIQSAGVIYMLIIAVGIMVPGVAMFNAQRAANIASDDELGTSNSSFNAGNIFWMLLGLVFWALTLVGIFLPEAYLQ